MKMYPKGGALVLELTARDALEVIERLSAEIRDSLVLGEVYPIRFVVDATDATGTTQADFILQLVASTKGVH
jgi:hypothetical protein